jgi:hypothetical protein
MRNSIKSPQRNPRVEVFRIAESSVPVEAASASNTTQTSTIMPEGWTRGYCSEQANNVYTIQFAEPFGRAPAFTVQALESGTGVSYICNIVSTSTTAISWRVENDASAAGAPTGFHVVVTGFDSADVL